MNEQLYKNIESSSASRESRSSNAADVLRHWEWADDLISIALDTEDKNHFKACWILELVLEKEIGWLAPWLDDFCMRLMLFSHHSALRSAAKICMLAAECHSVKMKKGEKFLTDKQLTFITEACFSWIIREEKVAVKAYSIRALYEAGKYQEWVYPELIPILQQGFSEHTPAYRAAAKNVLMKIKNTI